MAIAAKFNLNRPINPFQSDLQFITDSCSDLNSQLKVHHPSQNHVFQLVHDTIALNDMASSASLKVLICGGGIAGNALAFWLTKLGHNVTVLERYPGLRATGLQ